MHGENHTRTPPFTHKTDTHGGQQDKHTETPTDRQTHTDMRGQTHCKHDSDE